MKKRVAKALDDVMSGTAVVVLNGKEHKKLQGTIEWHFGEHGGMGGGIEFNYAKFMVKSQELLVTDQDFLDLITHIQVSTSLTSIDLSHNDISSRSIIPLAEAIKIMHSLAFIDLSYNKIEDEGLEALANVIRLSTSLIKINLIHNRLSNKGERILLDAKKSNPLFAVDINPSIVLNRIKSLLFNDIEKPSLFNLLLVGKNLTPLLPEDILSIVEGYLGIREIATIAARGIQISKNNQLQKEEHFVSGFKGIRGLQKVQEVKQQSLKEAENQGIVGPREIIDFDLEDVEDDGNCFYYAVANQMKIINYNFILNVPEGTDPNNSLRLAVQRENFLDREWADDSTFDIFVTEFPNVIIAIIDTRNPNAGFTLYYMGYDGNVITNMGDPSLVVPNHRVIIRIAATGNHFMSVRSHPELQNGALREKWNTIKVLDKLDKYLVIEIAELALESDQCRVFKGLIDCSLSNQKLFNYLIIIKELEISKNKADIFINLPASERILSNIHKILKLETKKEELFLLLDDSERTLANFNRLPEPSKVRNEEIEIFKSLINSEKTVSSLNKIISISDKYINGLLRSLPLQEAATYGMYTVSRRMGISEMYYRFGEDILEKENVFKSLPNTEKTVAFLEKILKFNYKQLSIFIRFPQLEMTICNAKKISCLSYAAADVFDTLAESERTINTIDKFLALDSYQATAFKALVESEKTIDSIDKIPAVTHVQARLFSALTKSERTISNIDKTPAAIHNMAPVDYFCEKLPEIKRNLEYMRKILVLDYWQVKLLEALPEWEIVLENLDKIPAVTKGQIQLFRDLPRSERVLKNLYKILKADLSGYGSFSAEEVPIASFYKKYYGNGLDDILSLRLEEEGIQGITNLESSLLSDRVNLDLKEIKTLLENGQSVVKPYNIDCKHWVGIAFLIDNENLHIKYIDSENKAIPQSLRASILEFLPRSKVIEQITNLESNNCCGAETIEGLIQSVGGKRIPTKEAVSYHMKLVEDSWMQEFKGSVASIGSDALMVIANNPSSSNALQPSIADSEVEYKFMQAFYQFLNIFKEIVTKFSMKLDLDINWLYKSMIYRQDLIKFNKVLLNNGIDRSIDVLREYPDFRKSVLLKLHPDKGGNTQDFVFVNDLQKKFSSNIGINKLLAQHIQAMQSVIYKTSLGFKVLDTIVDTTRFIYEPTIDHTKKLVLDCAYLYSMYSGVNGYSTIITGGDVLYQAYQGEYIQAFKQVITSAYMAIPTMIGHLGMPYFSFAYVATMTAYNGYSAITNAYSFYQEYGSVEFELRSAAAYKDFTQVLSNSPFQQIYDFAGIYKLYTVKINSINLDLEKTTIKTQLEAKGEFGQKLYNYIYSPALEEKYDLLSKVLHGILTEEKAEAIRSKHIKITLEDQVYEHCMEIKNIASNSNRDDGTNKENYYCYNDEQQILEHIIVGENREVEVVARL